MGRQGRPFRAAVAAAGAAGALLALPAAAPAPLINPPPCGSTYPTPFLIIDGSTVTKNTRWIEMRINPKTAYKVNAQADPNYPFPLTISLSQTGSHTYQVHNYAKDQFPATFHKGETAHVTAKYVEDHTEYSQIIGTYHVQCTRTVTHDFKAPPRAKHKKKHHHEDDTNQGEEP
ncbi:MAG: hypothetical protein E6G53_07205 [Actinobacteria bacterium]|nr:MAG: hypothetical protein E6G53_07205 [Actinomycetota bacterium]